MNISRAVSRIAFFRRWYRQYRMFLRIAACAVLVAMFSAPQLAAATIVHMVTTQGSIDIQLYDDQAPKTVANFLRYAGRGFYSTHVSGGVSANGFIYRSVRGFVIQSGSWTYANFGGLVGTYYSQNPMDPPIQNEFSLSNVIGTIAMAKLPGDPNSATSDWFINLADNGGSPNTNPPGLDYQNGGFTVFGNVIDNASDPGMAVVNAIGNLPILNASVYPLILDGIQNPPNSPLCSTICQNLPNGALYAIPVNNFDTTIGLDPSNLVAITSIPNVISTPTIQGSGQLSGPGDLLMTFTADADMAFTPGLTKTIDIDTSKTWLETFTPPSGETVHFNDGIFQFTMTGVVGPTGRTVTLHNDDPATANHYYAFGPTSDNPTFHWYDFMYDSTTGTGAEIVGNKIILHFVDGLRGDDDLKVNGSVTHTGGPATVAPLATSSSSGGCSIAATPSPMRSSGDWIALSMFLAFLALVRRRAHRDRNQRASPVRVTNIASP